MAMDGVSMDMSAVAAQAGVGGDPSSTSPPYLAMDRGTAAVTTAAADVADVADVAMGAVGTGAGAAVGAAAAGMLPVATAGISSTAGRVGGVGALYRRPMGGSFSSPH